MPDRLQLQRLWRWLLFLFVFAAIPALLLFLGFKHIFELQKQMNLQQLEQKIEKELVEFAGYADTEGFLVRELWRSYYKAKEPMRLQNVRDLRRELDECFDYLIFDHNQRLLEYTIDPSGFSGDWALALHSIHKAFTTKSDDLNFSAEEERNYKALFGPQLIPETMKECIYETNSKFVWPDIARIHASVWVGKSKQNTLLVFVRPEFFKSRLGMARFVRNYRKESILPGFYADGRVKTALPSGAEKMLAEALTAEYRFDRPYVEVAMQRFYFRVLNDETIVFFSFALDQLERNIPIAPWQALLLFVFLALPLLCFSFQQIVLNKNLRLSISWKLALLFFFAAGLPMAVLFFVGYDYLNQKESALFDELHQQGTRYLQNFDERYESEFANRIVLIQNAVKDYLPELQSSGIKPLSFFPFIARICQDLESIEDVQIFLVASSSETVGTEKLILKKKDIWRLPGVKEKKSDREEAKIYGSLGKFVIDSVNGQPVNDKVSTEVELLSESALQKNLYELQHEFISTNGQIRLFGMGARSSPAYVSLISVSPDGRQDYLLLVYWDLYKLEQIYLNRQFLNANRNINNFKVFACSESAGLFYPQSIIGQKELRDYVANFTQKPHPPRQFVEVNHQKQLIMGFKTKFMQNFSLFALYPAKEVAEEIYLQKKSLISAGIAAILITLLLGSLMVKGFLLPLQVISQGAEAIRKRNFDLRLPDLGQDEFGDIARLFNDTMVDFEELKVAGIVQEQLLPARPIEAEAFRVAGKSLSIGDVGGDYFDYFFEEEKGRLSLVIGDVSGRGVSAALVMAMAKATILQSLELLAQPSALLMRLHGLIKSAQRAGEHQEMSCQYLTLDLSSGCGRFANAGGLSPLLVNSDGSGVSSLEGTGRTLGSEEAPEFCEENFKVIPGQSLLLYTDGLIKLKDYSGKELGLDRFMKIAVEAYNADAQIYCRRVIDACRAFQSGSGGVADDLTILIMNYTGS